MLIACLACGKRISDRAEPGRPRGVALLALARDAEALSSFDQALAADPRFSLARYNKARAEERLGRPADAARSYQQFLSVAPPHLVAQIEDARQKLQELKPA